MKYNFREQIDSMRNDPLRMKVVTAYENFYGKIKGDIKSQKWYIEYVSLFEPAKNLQMDKNLENDIDIYLLSQLIQASFSSEYTIVKSTKDESFNDIFIHTENEGGLAAEKYLSELSEVQILNLFRIYVIEQMDIACLLKSDGNISIEVLTMRIEKLRKHKGLETRVCLKNAV